MVFLRRTPLLTITVVIALLFDSIRADSSAINDKDPVEGSGVEPSEVRRAKENLLNTDRPTIRPLNDETSEAIKLEQLSTRPVHVALRGAKSNHSLCALKGAFCQLQIWYEMSAKTTVSAAHVTFAAIRDGAT